MLSTCSYYRIASENLDYISQYANFIFTSYSLTFYAFRGGGELLKQLHALAEAESELNIHQRGLSEIEGKVGS